MAPPAPESRFAGLSSRAVSAAIMAGLALAAVFAGPVWFDILVAFGAATLAWEWTRLCGEGRFGKTGMLLALAVVASVAAAALGRTAMALVAAPVAGGLVYAMAREGSRVHPLWIAFGPVYIGVPCVALVWLYETGGRGAVLWLLATVWATDIGAYFAGRAVGGPRLWPSVSPGKTWAGLAGGMAAAGAVGAVASWIDPGAPAAGLLVAAGAALAGIAQLGDLAESGVKRRFGAKDSSRLIPGHGGLFDRVDGLLAAACALAAWQWASGEGALQWR